jgi:GrpB-like predicted nucleotidyltransferase (UPF0157 family)
MRAVLLNKDSLAAEHHMQVLGAGSNNEQRETDARKKLLTNQNQAQKSYCSLKTQLEKLRIKSLSGYH